MFGKEGQDLRRSDGRRDRNVLTGPHCLETSPVRLKMWAVFFLTSSGIGRCSAFVGVCVGKGEKGKLHSDSER